MALCLFNRLFRRISKKTSKLRVTSLCVGNSPGTVSNHWRFNCVLNRLFQRRSKETSKPRVTGLFEGNSPVTGEFPAQTASNAENVSIWWRHHESSTQVTLSYKSLQARWQCNVGCNNWSRQNQCVVHSWLVIAINCNILHASAAVKENGLHKHDLYPLHAKFFKGNINIYLHFVSFLHIDTTQVVEILPQIRQ